MSTASHSTKKYNQHSCDESDNYCKRFHSQSRYKKLRKTFINQHSFDDSDNNLKR